MVQASTELAGNYGKILDDPQEILETKKMVGQLLIPWALHPKDTAESNPQKGYPLVN